MDSDSKSPLLASATAVHPSIPIAIAAPISAAMAPISAEMTMGFESILAPHEGLLVREKLFASQLMCGALEKQLVFNVGSWNSSLPERLGDEHFAHLSGNFAVAGAPPIFSLREESECFNRYCCHQWRESTIGLFAEPFLVDPTDTVSTAQSIVSGGGWYGKTPLVEFFRPFKCTLVFPCAPCWMVNEPMMEVRVPSNPATGQKAQALGQVAWDWKWWNFIWHELHYTVMDDRSKPIYDLVVPNGCTNGFTNCCAPSCFNPTYSILIKDAVTQNVVGGLENQWPGCNFRGLCMSASAADNFVVKFPSTATPTHKALLTGALMLLNFNFFEQRDNQKNNQ